MITSIIRYHTAIHYIMSITRDRFRPYWVSSSGCKKHSIINMLKKTNLPLGAKKRKMQCKTIQYSNTYIMGVTFKDTHTWHGQQVTSVSPNKGVGSLLRLSIIHELLVASQQFSRWSPIKRNLPPASKYNRKICSKMITSIIRYHTAIHYIMSITRDWFRPYWVSSSGCKKHSIINMLKKNKFAIGCKKKKNAMQNNTIQQYLYHGGHIQGHTHMTWTTSHIGKP